MSIHIRKCVDKYSLYAKLYCVIFNVLEILDIRALLFIIIDIKMPTIVKTKIVQLM